MLLGTHRSDDFRDVEPEHPDCLAVIWPDGNVTSDSQDLPLFLDQALVKDLAGGTMAREGQRAKPGTWRALGCH